MQVWFSWVLWLRVSQQLLSRCWPGLQLTEVILWGWVCVWFSKLICIVIGWIQLLASGWTEGPRFLPVGLVTRAFPLGKSHSLFGNKPWTYHSIIFATEEGCCSLRRGKRLHKSMNNRWWGSLGSILFVWEERRCKLFRSQKMYNWENYKPKFISRN